jgi:hypothetical protein
LAPCNRRRRGFLTYRLSKRLELSNTGQLRRHQSAIKKNRYNNYKDDIVKMPIITLVNYHNRRERRRRDEKKRPNYEAMSKNGLGGCHIL